jgi:hypothetical protein
MKHYVRSLVCVLTLILAGSGPAAAQVLKYDSGQNIVPVFEGWQRTPDGNYKFHFGYLNRNYQENVDVPVGPNNKFEPGTADRFQPTHFYPRRQRFVFTVDVPKDWDKNRRLVWTITVNGKPETANGWLQPEWEIDEGVIQMNIGGGGAPPNPPNHYPQVTGGSNKEQTVAVNTPVTLSVQATDDGIPKPRKPRPNATTPPPKTGIKVRWLHYRGAGKIHFTVDQSEPVYGTPLDESTQASFDTPGDYVVRAVVTDGLLQTPYDILIHVK